MPTAEQKKFEPLIAQEEPIKQTHIHHDSLLTNWGIFTEETAKALIASVLRREQLYENIFRQPNTAVSSQVETLLNWLLDHKVLILEPAHIRNYLIRHFDLTRILRSTCKLALDRFGVQSQLSLAIYCDPEIEDEYLTLYIRQAQYSEAILKSILTVRSNFEGFQKLW